MDRYARRQHFERLMTLRDAYAQRGPEDSVSVISIEDVIAWVSDELDTDDATQFVGEDATSDAA
jgi:hypothetical protein